MPLFRFVLTGPRDVLYGVNDSLTGCSEDRMHY